MRVWFVLLVVALAPDADARSSWIARSYAGLLHDAEAVVAGEVGEVTRHTAAFHVERVLSGDRALGRQTVTLPVVRCNEPGPDGVTYVVSTCLDRTYQPGERLLLLLVDYGEGLRESGYPERSRAPWTDDAVGLAERLLALPDDSAARRAQALEALLADRRQEWRREAARAADPWLTLSHPHADALVALYQRTVDRLTAPLTARLADDPSLAVRAAAAAALGRSRETSLDATRALVDAVASLDDEVAYAAASALEQRRDPRAADALLRLTRDEQDRDRRYTLFRALAPVVRTDHADALRRMYDRAEPDDREPALRAWVLTGDDRAADEAARQVREADTDSHADAALRVLAESRDRRYADLALDRLQPVVCEEPGPSDTVFEAAAMLDPGRAVPVLAAYAGCTQAYPRWKAALALRRIDLPSARAALVAQLRTETSSENRQLILEAIGPLTPDEQLP